MKEITQETICKLLPERNPHTHKGDYGKILLLCGSRGYTGAAALAAMGAEEIPLHIAPLAIGADEALGDAS